MASSCAEEVDQVGRRMKRIGDDGAVCDRERCSELSVDFGEQDQLRRGRGAVKLGQSCERRLIGRGPASKRHAPFGRNAAWLSSAGSDGSVGSSAEAIPLRLRYSYGEFRGNDVMSFRWRVRARASLRCLDTQA